MRPVFAIVRRWCGQEAVEEFREVIALCREVDRLQGTFKDLTKCLQESGHNLKGALLMIELGGPDEYG